MLELAKPWVLAEIEYFELAWTEYLEGGRAEPELTGSELRRLTGLFNTVAAWITSMRLAA